MQHQRATTNNSLRPEPGQHSELTSPARYCPLTPWERLMRGDGWVRRQYENEAQEYRHLISGDHSSRNNAGTCRAFSGCFALTCR
jgi:hypothetical protein